MSTTSNQKFLQEYVEKSAGTPMFLSSFFQTPPRNYHATEKVGIDVRRNNPHIAIPVPSISSGPRRIEISKFVNKEFTPPIFKDQVVLNSWDSMKRQEGQSPFEDADFARNIRHESESSLSIMEDRFRRSIEVMAAQVLLTGQLSLKDDSDAELYELNFEPKATHVATVGTAWATNGSTGDPLADIENLAEVVRQDGKEEPTDLIFGRSAKQRFLANAGVIAAFDKQKFNLGQMTKVTGFGATKFAVLTIGQYEFNCWTYNDTYIHPNTGLHTPYITTDKMVMRCATGRMDLTFGAIPRIIPPDGRLMQFLPARFPIASRGIDMHVTPWCTPDGEQLAMNIACRPLTIPTAIDTVASLDVAP